MWRNTHVGGLIEADAPVEGRDLGNVLLGEVEFDGSQVGGDQRRTRALGNNGEAALGGPTEQDLGRVPAILGGDALDGVVLDEGRQLDGVLHVELEEAGRAEGAVGGDGDALLLGQVQQLLLDEVRVVLDLQGGRADLGVPQQVIDELGLEVGDTNALGEATAYQPLHGSPSLLDGGLAGTDLGGTVIVPTRRVADRRVDVFKSDGEVDQVEVEIVDAPVGQLLLDDGLHALAIVEGVPELGDDE